MIDINITGNSIDAVIEHLDNVAGPWKVQKSLDGYSEERWKPVEYGIKIWSKLRRSWVFENDLFYWCWNKPAPEPSEVLVITNTHGDWCESAITNQRMCSERAGYTYMRMTYPPPGGTSANWSKFVAVKRAIELAIQNNHTQVIWLDADILFSRQIPFGNIFPRSELTCGWYFPTEFYESEKHRDGIANGCMFSLAASEKNLSDVSDVCDNAHRNRYCQSYPFEEVELKRLYKDRDDVYRFDHITTTPHSMWRLRENYTGIHHCVSGMHTERSQAMEDTHRMFLTCDL